MFLRNIATCRRILNIIDVIPYSRCSESKINVKIKGMFCVLSTEQSSSNVGEILERWSKRFENDGVPEPVESIEHIVAHVMGTSKVMDVLNAKKQNLSSEQMKKLESLCECRLLRMPVQYIIGEWDFRDITLKILPPIFIPRPETEILVDFVLKRLNSSKLQNCEILEIGCGSGAISLSIAHSCKNVKCIAIDTYENACKLTKINRENLNLADRVTILHATLKEDGTIEESKKLDENNFDLSSKLFDFIVSNPPYIPTKKILDLEPEIKFYEDWKALDGGEDGLKVIKPILQYSAKALKSGGHLLMEVDPEHVEYINFFTKKYDSLKLRLEHTYKDYSNNDRFIEVSKIP